MWNICENKSSKIEIDYYRIIFFLFETQFDQNNLSFDKCWRCLLVQTSQKIDKK